MIPHQSAYSISNFCKSHDISRAYFYELVALGLGPRLIKLGRRVLISAEAGADWRREMEERTAAQNQTDAYHAGKGRTQTAIERVRTKQQPGRDLSIQATKGNVRMREAEPNAGHTAHADSIPDS